LLHMNMQPKASLQLHLCLVPVLPQAVPTWMSPAACSAILGDTLDFCTALDAQLARIIHTAKSDLSFFSLTPQQRPHDALAPGLFNELLKPWLLKACDRPMKLTPGMVGKLLSMCTVVAKQALRGSDWVHEEMNLLKDVGDEAVAGQVAAAVPEIFHQNLVRTPR
jgi:hypothetical protein